MNKKSICIGLGVGMMVCGMSALAMKPRKKCRMKKAVGKALIAMGDVVDSVSDALGI